MCRKSIQNRATGGGDVSHLSIPLGSRASGCGRPNCHLHSFDCAATGIPGA
ncbi:hypothetical protein CGRA01v4_03769 [Colletotrichum graminicola]|nr:hypothetical protein CGRA01v4_03769 [Colletotrichum graminicola]